MNAIIKFVLKKLMRAWFAISAISSNSIAKDSVRTLAPAAAVMARISVALVNTEFDAGSNILT